MDAYRAYLRQARGEWSVSKNVYVALRSGWFSCRSAVYLALGKPVVVQDTGWSTYYSAGAGLFAFETPDEAVAGLEAASADYRRQCEAARAVAEERLRGGQGVAADCSPTAVSAREASWRDRLRRHRGSSPSTRRAGANFWVPLQYLLGSAGARQWRRTGSSCCGHSPTSSARGGACDLPALRGGARRRRVGRRRALPRQRARRRASGATRSDYGAAAA